jgi:REP element-mobilizing transposase RayT
MKTECDPEIQKKNANEEEELGGTGFQPVGDQELLRSRRNLPHWQFGGSTYFVTFRTEELDLIPEARNIVLDACRHFDGNRYTLWSAVVMPNHVHLLVQPKEMENGKWHSLSAMHSIKSFTAKKVNDLLKREGSVWQDESLDRIIRDEAEFLEKWNYIRNNPIKNGLVDSPDEWIGFYEITGKMPGATRFSYDRVGARRAVPISTPLGDAIENNFLRRAIRSNELRRSEVGARRAVPIFARNREERP